MTRTSLGVAISSFIGEYIPVPATRGMTTSKDWQVLTSDERLVTASSAGRASFNAADLEHHTSFSPIN